MDEKLLLTIKRLKQRRAECGLSYQGLSDKTGFSKSVLQRYETGAIEKISLSRLNVIAQALDVSPEWLAGFNVPMNGRCDNLTSSNIANNSVSVPIIGTVAAGYDSIAVEEWTGDSIEVPDTYLRGHNLNDYFCLEVHGDSMYPMYQDGDKVLILRQPSLNRSGDIGVIIYNDEEATLKKVEYIMGEDWMKLIPINPIYQPILIEGEELEHCRVIGIPKLLIREIV